MGGFIRSNLERPKPKQINTTVNKEVYDDFKDWCKVKGYPINVMIETFMNQFVGGQFLIDYDKAKEMNKSAESKVTLNTTVNLKSFNKFKDCCKAMGYPINVILTGFMRQFIDEEYILEFRKIDEEL